MSDDKREDFVLTVEFEGYEGLREFGPFTTCEQAELCMVTLAARENVLSAIIDQ